MPYVVAEPCIKCKYTDCVAVCPVDCFYEGVNSLVINPDECIDCGACEPECPTKAIFDDSSLPAKWKPFVEINAVLSGAKTIDNADTSDWPEHLIQAVQAPEFNTWPNINQQKDPLPEADANSQREQKSSELDPRGGSSE